MTSIVPAHTARFKNLSFNTGRHPRQRMALLLIFLFASLACYIVLSLVAPQFDPPLGHFYLSGPHVFFAILACLWVPGSMPLIGRWRWAELGCIFVGAVVFRVMACTSSFRAVA